METTIQKHVLVRFTDKTKEWMVYSICLLCLALFAAAAYDKVAGHETFVKGLSKVPLIGEAAIYLAWLVPMSELSIAVLLIVPQSQRCGLYGFVGLMTVFTVYLMSMLLWAEQLPCHCNLIIDKLSWEGHLWFNAGFIALAVFALWLGRAKNKLKNKIMLRTSKNFKKITLSLLVAGLVVGASAFKNANNNAVKITRNAEGKIISVTSFFYNLDGNPANTATSNFIYRDGTTPASCRVAVNTKECRAQWTTSSMPLNNQSPAAAGSPSYVGNGIEGAVYNGR